MNVADGMPAKMKELLARRCLENGTTAFTNMVLAQQLLPDSPAEEREDTFDTTEWVSITHPELMHRLEADVGPGRLLWRDIGRGRRLPINSFRQDVPSGKISYFA
jgi:hypothetical protein